MDKLKLIILIAVVATLPFILIGVLSTIQNRQRNQQVPLKSIPTLTPTPQTSNINEYKTISGRIVEIDPEYIVISTNGTNQKFEFDRDIKVNLFKVEDVVTLVFNKQSFSANEEGELVMDIIKK